MIPSHKELRTRDYRTVDSYTFARSKRTLGTGRTFNHTGVHGDTLTLTPSFTTLTDKFAISLKQADNNVYARQEMFENEQNEKIALFGIHPVARVIASFVMGATKKKDIRFFKSREEAFLWLKE